MLARLSLGRLQAVRAVRGGLRRGYHAKVEGTLGTEEFRIFFSVRNSAARCRSVPLPHCPFVALALEPGQSALCGAVPAAA